MVDGIPAVEAVWWAGGLRVTERIFALAGEDAFVRRIELASVNLSAPEQVTLRLSLPPGDCTERDGTLIQKAGKIGLAVGVAGGHPSRAMPEKGVLEIGPFWIAPGRSVGVDTVLLAGIFPADVAASWPPASLLKSGLPSALERTRSRWAASSSIATDDAVVRELFDNARFGLPGMIADNGVMDAGIFEYGGQWVRDTSNTLLGMVHAGQFELARSGFEHILKDMITRRRQDHDRWPLRRPRPRGVRPDGRTDPRAEGLPRLDAATTRCFGSTGRSCVAMIERPLRPEFRDATGMVHNRREFWERILDDGYELAYQTYVVLGLRDAADLAEPLGAQDRAAALAGRGRPDAARHALASHPRAGGRRPADQTPRHERPVGQGSAPAGARPTRRARPSRPIWPSRTRRWPCPSRWGWWTPAVAAGPQNAGRAGRRCGTPAGLAAATSDTIPAARATSPARGRWPVAS